MTNLAFFKPLKLDSRSAAEKICGKLSHPSKMPGAAYSIPAKACKVGSALHKVKGSTCSKCYAMRNNYLWPAVQKSMQQRLESLTHPQWPDAMAYLISDSETKHFRWHDSGDLQSLAHLLNIVRVAELLPKVKFYLPTREKKVVHDYLRSFGRFPRNLVVRLSAAMVDASPPEGASHTSTVHRHGAPSGFACPAHLQGNKCGDCRACWDGRVKNISYPYH